MRETYKISVIKIYFLLICDEYEEGLGGNCLN